MTTIDETDDAEIEFSDQTFGEQVYDRLVRRGTIKKVLGERAGQKLRRIDSVVEMKEFLGDYGYGDIILLHADANSVVRQLESAYQRRIPEPVKWGAFAAISIFPEVFFYPVLLIFGGIAGGLIWLVLELLEKGFGFRV